MCAQPTPKALCLLSGGLDSTLAARIMLDLGVELEAVNFVTAFCTCTPKTAGCAAAVSAARRLGIRVRTFNSTESMIGLVKDPPHGHGSYLNPCIDCRILTFRRALEYMREVGAEFLVTGEVLGQRPMSQRRDAMHVIERESGADGLVLRPLCAGLLEPSLPERTGRVDRDRMLSISGRSRKPQIALARELGVNDYPCPAGGCRLTDPGFAGRMLDLIEHSDEIDVRDVNLLRCGRHFRLSAYVRADVGRNEGEKLRIAELARPGEPLAQPVDVPGPTALVVGRSDADDVALTCSIAARYASPDADRVEFEVTGAGPPARVAAAPLREDRVEALRVRALERGWRRRKRLESLP